MVLLNRLAPGRYRKDPSIVTLSENFARKLLTVQNLMDLGAHKHAATLLRYMVDMVPNLPKEERLEAVTKCEELALKGVAAEDADRARRTH